MMPKTLSKVKKLASGTTKRSVREWWGKTPNTRPPLQVQLRILERQGGRCAITGIKFKTGDKKRLDHRVAQADCGQNRESNLQWIFDDKHKIKSALEAAARAKVTATKLAHAGIRKPPAMQSRNDLPQSAQAQKRTPKRIPLPQGSALARLGFEPASRWRK
jgi:hypothetical protein